WRTNGQWLHMNTMTVAMPDFSSDSDIVVPETASVSAKSLATVPSGIILEGVSAMTIPAFHRHVIQYYTPCCGFSHTSAYSFKVLTGKTACRIEMPPYVKSGSGREREGSDQVARLLPTLRGQERTFQDFGAGSQMIGRRGVGGCFPPWRH